MISIPRGRLAHVVAAAALVIANAPAALGVPQGFNIQGRLTDSNGVNRHGDYDLEFSLHDHPELGNTLWTRAYSASNQSAVPVRNGNFTLVLSDVQGQTPLASVFAGDPRYLQIRVLGGPGIASPEPPLRPRQQLVSVPYSLRSQATDTIPAKVTVATLTVTSTLRVEPGWAPDFESTFFAADTNSNVLTTVIHNLGVRPRRVVMWLSEREDGGGWTTPVGLMEHLGGSLAGIAIAQNNPNSLVLHLNQNKAFTFDAVANDFHVKRSGYVRVMLWK